MPTSTMPVGAPPCKKSIGLIITDVHSSNTYVKGQELTIAAISDINVPKSLNFNTF